MSRVRPKQAEGLQFLSNYQTAFTTREDGSSWPKHERTWLNVGRYFRGLLRPGSSNTFTDIAEKMHIDQERLERFVRECPWAHENVESELRERVPEAIQGREAALIVDGMGACPRIHLAEYIEYTGDSTSDSPLTKTTTRSVCLGMV